MKLTRENRNTRGKTCPIATLSTTNLMWTDPESKPGLRGERPATNRLSHGTATANVLCKRRLSEASAEAEEMANNLNITVEHVEL
jgi:hypothetical protein